MSDNKKYDIFISYSRNDAAIVNEVVAALKSAGFSIWIDKDGIYSGDAFKSVIVNAIDNSDTVLFFSSESANASPWTTKEIAVAIFKHKRVIPIRLDDSSYSAEIMFDLVNLDYIELSDRTEINACVERLIKTLGNKQQPLPNSNNSINQSEKYAPASGKSTKKNNKFKFLLSYKGCMISITCILIGFITLPFVFRDEIRKDKKCEISRIPLPDAVPSHERDDSYKGREHSTVEQDNSKKYDVIVLQGKVAGKDAELKMTPACEYGYISIDGELVIDGVKFHNFTPSYLDRRTLFADLVNNDGIFIGILDGLLTIENSTLTYKGTTSSQDKTELFKDGTFEFKGVANDEFIQLYQSQFKE